jgi:hypothetical protein
MKHKLNFIGLLFLVLLYPIFSWGQLSPAESSDANEIARATKFTIPSAPAFVLLDINPAKVIRPASIKDIKIDMIVKENKFVTDFAIQCNPYWLVSDSSSLTKYLNMNSFERALTSIDFSAGMAQNDDKPKAALAIKMSLINKDPLNDSTFRGKISEKLDIGQRQMEIGQQLAELSISPNIANKDSMRAALLLEALQLESNIQKEVQRVVAEQLQSDWNSGGLDIAAGYLMNLSSASIDSAKIQSDGFGAWLNGAQKIGNRAIAAGMAKFVSISDKINQFYGANFKYGDSQKNGFIEFTFENNDNVNIYSIAYGGEYRIDATKAIEFGLRHTFDSDFSLKQLEPSIRINWNPAKSVGNILSDR